MPASDEKTKKQEPSKDKPPSLESIAGSGLGVRSVANGKIAWKFNGTDFFITGSIKAGMRRPLEGSSSFLFVYKATNPRKLYRLDFEVMKTGPNAGQIGWEHNVRKVAKVLRLEEAGIRQHEPAGSAGIRAGQSMRILRYGGNALFVINAADSAIQVLAAHNKVKVATREVSAWIVSAEAAQLLGRFGAWTGGEIGLLAGIGAMPAAVTGAVAGAIIGGIAGFRAGKAGAEYIYKTTFQAFQSEEWAIAVEPPSFGGGGRSGGGGAEASW